MKIPSLFLHRFASEEWVACDCGVRPQPDYVSFVDLDTGVSPTACWECGVEFFMVPGAILEAVRRAERRRIALLIRANVLADVDSSRGALSEVAVMSARFALKNMADIIEGEDA